VEWLYVGDLTNDEAKKSLKQAAPYFKKELGHDWKLTDEHFEKIIEEVGTQPGSLTNIMKKTIKLVKNGKDEEVL